MLSSTESSMAAGSSGRLADADSPAVGSMPGSIRLCHLVASLPGLGYRTSSTHRIRSRGKSRQKTLTKPLFAVLAVVISPRLRGHHSPNRRPPRLLLAESFAQVLEKLLQLRRQRRLFLMLAHPGIVGGFQMLQDRLFPRAPLPDIFRPPPHPFFLFL